MKFCSRCLYSETHPLGITFNNEGLCSGCQIHDEKNSLNWNHRLKRLKKIVKEYKSLSGQNYDCIVPVSGGYDSYFIMHTVKNILNLNPLAVTYNKYFNTPTGIKNLSNLRIKFDVDILIQNVNPKSVKKITSYTLEKYGNIYWPCIAGQTVFPVQIAKSYRIPLIIWGAHQGVEQVGMFSHTHEVEMNRRYRKNHDLFGVEAEDLLKTSNLLNEEDIYQYIYPEDKDINEIGIRGIYLGNFIRWDPKAQHESMIKMYDFKTHKFLRTFDHYDFVDCFNYMHLHDLLKFYKHGYSKVTDHAVREIRHHRISRDCAISLVKKFEKGSIKHLKLFCDWLNINEGSLKFILQNHINKSFINDAFIDPKQITPLSAKLESKKNYDSIKFIQN